MNLAYRPMLATLVSEPFDDKDWVFETKWDGFRLVTEKRGDKVTLWSRDGINVAKSTQCCCRRFKRSRTRASLTAKSALDAQGRSRFQLLQNALNKNAKLLYVVFDALFVDGTDIRQNRCWNERNF